MNLDAITPMILTRNEEANLRSTLARLSWARQILVVDSFSEDETLTIASEFPQVQVIQRAFDHFADQCNFGLSRIQTTWTLSIDADYKCDESFARDLEQLDNTQSGYVARFRYCIYGRPLRATLYPPRIVLYRTDRAHYHRDGHAHRVDVSGEIGTIKTPILHDDWKPLSSWLGSQVRYAQCEADKLCESSSRDLGWKDRLRKRVVFAPVLTLLYCLFRQRLIFDGWRGMFYTFQRVYAELLLSLVLLERKLRTSSRGEDGARSEPRHR